MEPLTPTRAGTLWRQAAEALQRTDGRGAGAPGLESETLLMYRAHSNALTAYARVFMGDAEQADEVVHEVFLRYLLHRAQDGVVDAPRQWLLDQVHGLLNERSWIAARVQQSAASAEASRCENLLLDCAERKLPRWQRDTFRMRMRGLAYEEIASELGIDVKLVSRHLSLGIKRLRELVMKDELAG